MAWEKWHSFSCPLILISSSLPGFAKRGTLCRTRLGIPSFPHNFATTSSKMYFMPSISQWLCSMRSLRASNCRDGIGAKGWEQNLHVYREPHSVV